ncbi:MAG: ABC transporter permease [Candidatus Korobacteraceae bacterium]|jgi:ABC-type spermidine/putrescine transport system permease subunit II
MDGSLLSAMGRNWVRAMGAAVLAFLVVPVLFVFPMSLSSSMIFELIPEKPGLTQYARFFGSSNWMRAVLMSVQAACGTTVLATILGVLASLGLHRFPTRWRASLEAMLILPRIVPSIVFAVAAYSLFLRVGLAGSLLGLIVAHSILATPFVVVLVSSALAGFDRSQEEASRSLGANQFQTFFRITLPQIRLAVFAGALFAFNVSFDEVVVTLFISGTYTKTLPVKVWDAILYEMSPILPAISALIISVTLLIMVPVLLMQRRTAAP